MEKREGSDGRRTEKRAFCTGSESHDNTRVVVCVCGNLLASTELLFIFTWQLNLITSAVGSFSRGFAVSCVLWFALGSFFVRQSRF